MGQLFKSVAIDKEEKKVHWNYADKFYGYCYSVSMTVHRIHYLLREKSYHVLWGGDNMFSSNWLKDIEGEESLENLSAYLNFRHKTDEDLLEEGGEKFLKKARKIDAYADQWSNMDDFDKIASDKYDWYLAGSALYKGYLVNHNHKLAINLETYYQSSLCTQYQDGFMYVVDPIPVLTETGGSVGMVFYDGMTDSTTIELEGTWCGDLLQILDELPDGFSEIKCCFAPVIPRAVYCYNEFGVNENKLVFADEHGALLKFYEYLPIRKHKENSENICIIPTETGIRVLRAPVEDKKETHEI